MHWTFDPSDYLHKQKMVAVLTDQKTNQHKHKTGARDSMLGYLISTWYVCVSAVMDNRILKAFL